MKSPFTGKEMKLQKEQRQITFRKETFEVLFHYWRCEDTDQQLTSTELDELNIGQAYNQYRSLHRLPFPDEIRAIRAQYEISANKMSEILGFGINVYRQYETGEVPSESNARLIQLARDPEQFRSLVELCGALGPKAMAKTLHRIDHLTQSKENTPYRAGVEDYLIGPMRPDEYSGYKRPSLEKFAAMVVEFSKVLNPWKTKLNKLVFYADFLHFSRTCNSISGMRYVAYNLGPVPSNFQLIYQFLADHKAFEIEYFEYENGSIGERFKPPQTLNEDDILTVAELATIAEVAERFKNMSSKEIIETSHLEKAWRESIKLPNHSISYLKFGFELDQV
jgi:putative zinc finger/helix-turn-helix YgiT family protein